VGQEIDDMVGVSVRKKFAGFGECAAALHAGPNDPFAQCTDSPLLLNRSSRRYVRRRGDQARQSVNWTAW
jgi:hypothetical protein